MNHTLKINEAAFNEGVKEALQLRPLVRAVKAAVQRSETKKNLAAKVVKVDRKR